MRAGLLCMIALSLSAQRLSPPRPIPGFTFDASQLPKIRAVHIHPIMHGSCMGKPDHVYGDSGGVYYACISEQDVCTASGAHRGARVPSALITQYQQVKAVLKAQREARSARFERERQERQQRLAREGRGPNLAQFTRSNSALESDAGAPVRTVDVATADRATTVPLADTRLDGIAAGAALNDVIKALGKPYSRITGESERLTYRLESGGLARLDFERSVLVRIERSGSGPAVSTGH